MIFNSAGRYLGPVLQPKHRDPDTKHEYRVENFTPIQQSYDCQFYLLERKRGTQMVEGKSVQVSEICVAKLLKDIASG